MYASPILSSGRSINLRGSDRSRRRIVTTGLGALKKIPQISDHPSALLGYTEELGCVELLLEMFKEIHQLVATGQQIVRICRA